MPYRWTPENITLDAPKSFQGTAPLIKLEIWPHRSMPNVGFKAAIWLMFGAGILPLLSFVGTSAFWILLLCLIATLTSLWFALRKSDRPHLRETLLIWPDRLELSHWDTQNRLHEWSANPHWLRMHIHPERGPVEQYLTLKDAGPHDTQSSKRVVELAAFLSPEERVNLREDLAYVVGQLT